MGQRIKPLDVEQHLAAAGKEPSEYDASAGEWEPGYRCAAQGPRLVIVLHDGPGEELGLSTYTDVLRAAGLHVIPDRQMGQRHRLIVTRP